MVCNGGAVMPSIFDAVNIGDETSAVAVIAGALAGALSGVSSTSPEDRRTVLDNNPIDIEGTGTRFCELIERRRAEGKENCNSF